MNRFNQRQPNFYKKNPLYFQTFNTTVIHQKDYISFFLSMKSNLELLEMGQCLAWEHLPPPLDIFDCLLFLFKLKSLHLYLRRSQFVKKLRHHVFTGMSLISFPLNRRAQIECVHYVIHYNFHKLSMDHDSTINSLVFVPFQ